MTDKPKPPTDLVAVAPRAGSAVKPFVPSTASELKYVAGLIVKYGLAPDSYNNDAGKVALGIMAGAEVGLAPLAALRNIAIIKGRPAIYGDGLTALVQRSGQLHKIEIEETGAAPDEGADHTKFADDYGYVVKIWRKGQEEPYVGRFTVGDAKRAKLWGNPSRPPWMQYPQRMLKIRARTFALRDGFADYLEGLMVREELEDIPGPVETPSTDFLDDLPDAVVVEPDEDVTVETDAGAVAVDGEKDIPAAPQNEANDAPAPGDGDAAPEFPKHDHPPVR